VVTAAAVQGILTAGDSTTLSAVSSGGVFMWSPAAGLSCISCQNPIATPSATTVYCVTVTDTNNCTDSACVTITVLKEPVDCSKATELYFPNAFSPNNDFENDELRIYYPDLTCIETFALVLYDRWGEKVYETNDPAFEWDGRGKDAVQNTGVFAYFVKVILITGEEAVKHGNISLFR
jgi:gliding motility-associated-like protein